MNHCQDELIPYDTDIYCSVRDNKEYTDYYDSDRAPNPALVVSELDEY